MAKRDLDPEALRKLLAQLYKEQLALEANEYLREHSQPKAIGDHVAAFQWYAQHLPQKGTVLDWGCCHGPDSCLMRAAYGSDLEIHACDFYDPRLFQVFRRYAQAQY